MDVDEIMVEDVLKIDAAATVKEAVDMMNRNEIGCLIITADGKVSGIITERDVLKRVVGESKDANKTKVSAIMSKPVITVGPDMYVEDAAKLMFKRNIKKLPIEKKGRVVGIITLTDVARVASMEPQIAKVIDDLKKNGWLPSKRMKRVVDFYIADWRQLDSL
ncbi:MAG: CBS domain-containing protein [Candidatus Bathyarchaeota archaeon]|nr:CBS domain-containing protein [Candidatus Bathyarchaeota archaeon]